VLVLAVSILFRKINKIIYLSVSLGNKPNHDTSGANIKSK